MEKQFYNVNVKDEKEFAIVVQANSAAEAQTKALNYYKEHGPNANWQDIANLSVAASGPIGDANEEEIIKHCAVIE